MNKKIKILHLEDSLEDSKLIHSMIDCEKNMYEYFLLDNKKDYLNILEKENIDLILADYNLPDYNGNEALKVVKEKYSNIPFIFVSGIMGEDAAINAMLNGAKDYVLKHKLDRLVPAIKRALKENETEVNQKRAEDELRESQAMLRKARQLAHLGVWDWRADNDVVNWTEELYQIAGLDPELPAPTYAQHADLYTSQSWLLLKTAVEEAMKTCKPYELELELIRPDGTIRNVIAFGGAKVDDKGQITGLYGTVQDITERKQAEEGLRKALVKAESVDRLKTAFIHNISHEVRTPLNGILGFSSLLAMPGLTDEEKEGFFSMIQLSSNRLLKTITDYMDISMIVSGTIEMNKKSFDLHEILNNLQKQFQPICDVKFLELKIDIPNQTESFILHSDSELFSKVISHLLDNAIKFTDKGEIVFGYTIESGLLKLFVKDTGIGINKETNDRIFESFITEEYSATRIFEGSRLGLSIAHGMVGLLGGEIGFKSEKDIGSTFFFSIPIEAKEKGADKPAKKEIKALIFERPVILIAEDDKACLTFLEIVLRKANIGMISACNGKQAVELCHNHPEISLVLMDIVMPVMDGIAAIREIKSFRENLPIIAITAYAIYGDEKRAIEAGCIDYLSKPVDKDVLLKKLKHFGVL